jgi:hypothetical protein
MTDRSQEITQDNDLRNLVRIVSACALGLWAFAAGLLIGSFCSRDRGPARADERQPPAPIGSRNRFIVNSMFADCSSRQLSISV